MKKLFIRLIIILVLTFVSAGAQQSLDTIRVMTYNILKYDGSERNNYLNTVVSSVDPDVIIVQEMESQTGVNSFLANVLNNEYTTIQFNDGTYDTESHVFYKSYKIDFIDDNYLSTRLRDIAEYEVRIKSNNETVFFYSLHLKASQGLDNEQRRLGEVQILRESLDRHSPGTNFIVLGDFNIYYSNEPAYQKLIQEENNVSGQSFDPIDTPGSWHNSSNYASVHTQSSRAVKLPDGGSDGGLDDRFDFILISSPLWDNVNVSSYTEYGNDGAHLNKSINDGTNSAVSSEMADVIFYASDHLPVFCDFVFEVATSMEYEPKANPQKFQLYQNYPNPFNPSTKISFSLPESEHVVLTVFDILGKKVRTVLNESLHAGFHEIEFNTGQLPGSVYFYRLQAGESIQTRKFILLK